MKNVITRARSSSSWITSVATFPLISFPTTSSWEIPQSSTCPQTQPRRSSHAMLGSSATSRRTTVIASTGFFCNAWRTMSSTLRRSTSSIPFKWSFKPGHTKWSRKQFSTTSALQDPLNRRASRWCQWGVPTRSKSHRRPRVANPAVPLSQPNGHQEFAELPRGTCQCLHTRCGWRHRRTILGTVRPAGGSQRRWSRWQLGAPCSECCRSLQDGWDAGEVLDAARQLGYSIRCHLTENERQCEYDQDKAVGTYEYW